MRILDKQLWIPRASRKIYLSRFYCFENKKYTMNFHKNFNRQFIFLNSFYFWWLLLMIERIKLICSTAFATITMACSNDDIQLSIFRIACYQLVWTTNFLPKTPPPTTHKINKYFVSITVALMELRNSPTIDIIVSNVPK